MTIISLVVEFFVLCVNLLRVVVPLVAIANFSVAYLVACVLKNGATVLTAALWENADAFSIVSVNLADRCIIAFAV